MSKGRHATHTTRTQGVGRKAGLGLVAGVTMAGMLASPGIAMASEVDATPDATQPQVQATNAANPTSTWCVSMRPRASRRSRP